MEGDSWNRPVTANSPSDIYMDHEPANEVADEPSSELPCPFCPESLDIVGLCCHIYEEHEAEAKSGVCPICNSMVEMHVVGHITMEHGNFFKVQNRALRKRYSGLNSRISFLRKELRKEQTQSFTDGSSYSLTHAQPDPLILAFLSTFSPAEPSKDARLSSLDDEDSKLKEKVGDESADRDILVNARRWKNPGCDNDTNREEQSRRSQFLQELLLSIVFEGSR